MSFIFTFSEWWERGTSDTAALRIICGSLLFFLCMSAPIFFVETRLSFDYSSFGCSIPGFGLDSPERYTFTDKGKIPDFDCWQGFTLNSDTVLLPPWLATLDWNFFMEYLRWSYPDGDVLRFLSPITVLFSSFSGFSSYMDGQSESLSSKTLL